jgi:hypothetical protein
MDKKKEERKKAKLKAQ